MLRGLELWGNGEPGATGAVRASRGSGARIVRDGASLSFLCRDTAKGDRAVRPSARWGRAKKRHSAAVSTVRAHAATITRPAPDYVSVPVASACTMAERKANQLNQ